MKSVDQQKGVGLIEVLIAGLVFAVGITAVVQLQGTFFKSSSAAHARSIAMSIAQEKIEDLRGFQVTDSSGPTNTKFYFTAITPNAGGRCNTFSNGICTSLVLPSGPVPNTIYNRSWAVTNYYYNGGVLTTTPSGDIVQKAITVTVAWTDNDGSAQTASLSTVINKISGAASTGLLANSIGGSGEKPVVTYTPSTDTHVTPISVGTDTKRETLVPSSQTVGGYSRTKFIAYTYGIGGTLIRQEEFENVACDCRFNGISGNDLNPFDDTDTSDDATYTAAHHLWNTATDTYVDVDGDLVSGKVKGCVQGGGSNCASNPEPLCNICCKDHHDATTAAYKFDPFRSSDDFTSGDHNHYHGTNPVTSGEYLEACRLKRVNGFWRVFQDWNLVKFTVLPLSDLTDITTKATYTTYVQAVIDEHLEESKVSGENLSSPPVKPSTLNHTVSSNYVTMAVGDKRELTARAVYLDFIDSDHLTHVKNKKTANQDYLLHLPFYEMEVAPVSNWLSDTPATVNVGPSGHGSSALIAGQLAALSTNTSPVSVTGTIKKSNSGIVALTSAVDYNAATNPDSATQSDSVSVCVGGGCTGAPSADCTLPWGGTIVSGNSTTAYQSAAVPFGSSCLSQTRTCSNGTLSGTYTNQSCSVLPALDCTAPWGTSVANGISITAYLASTVISPAICTSETRTCTSGTLSGSYTHETCSVSVSTCVTTVTGKANNKDDTITLSVDGGSPTICPVASSKNYTCPVVTTPLSSIITVTSSGTVNSTATILPICGAKTQNF
jgi:Tfp pilus assembly protein PilV